MATTPTTPTAGDVTARGLAPDSRRGRAAPAAVRGRADRDIVTGAQSAVSAIKVNGQRAYALVRRKGEDVALAARPVTVSRFDVPRRAFEADPSTGCAAGTRGRSTSTSSSTAPRAPTSAPWRATWGPRSAWAGTSPALRRTRDRPLRHLELTRPGTPTLPQLEPGSAVPDCPAVSPRPRSRPSLFPTAGGHRRGGRPRHPVTGALWPARVPADPTALLHATDASWPSTGLSGAGGSAPVAVLV
jgi:tRNA pseudouridine55 synthase